jgi:mono/diheme cytochrome c family protein
MVLLVGCGGGSGAGSSSSAAKDVPTMPAARFAMPTTMITVAPGATLTATVAAATPAPAETPDLARGERLYASKGCAECHGDKGEGVAGKGSAVAGTPLDAQTFDDLMRTGGDGKLGPDHLYGPSAISPSGMAALHAWLQSLPPTP